MKWVIDDNCFLVSLITCSLNSETAILHFALPLYIIFMPYWQLQGQLNIYFAAGICLTLPHINFRGSPYEKLR